MKTMNVQFRCVTIAALLVATAFLLGSLTRGNTTTPCGANVVTTALVGDDWTLAQKEAIDAGIETNFPAVTVHELSATKSYNCHSYAWDGGANGWMNDPGPYIDSYAPDVSNGDKLTYMHCLTNGPSHSAVVTGSYTATSKWGALSLVDHDWDDVPNGTNGYADYGDVAGVYGAVDCDCTHADCAT